MSNLRILAWLSVTLDLNKRMPTALSCILMPPALFIVALFWLIMYAVNLVWAVVVLAGMALLIILFASSGSGNFDPDFSNVMKSLSLLPPYPAGWEVRNAAQPE